MKTLAESGMVISGVGMAAYVGLIPFMNMVVDYYKVLVSVMF